MDGPDSSLTVAVEQGVPPVVRISGEADYNNRLQISGALEQLLSDGFTTMHADLSDLRYIDSSALAALVGSAAEVRRLGGVVELTGASRHVAKLLNQCGASIFFRSSTPDVPVAGDEGANLGSESFWHAFDFSLPAGPSSVATARQRVGDVLRSLPLTVAESADVLIAFGEAVTNAVRHGCDCNSSMQFGVKCVAGPSRLTVDVTDPGPGFNPTAVPKPRPESIVEGGMGIWIMRELMDEVLFLFIDDHTTTRIVKYIPAGRSTVPAESG